LSDRFNQWLRQPSLSPLREAWLEALRPADELRVVLQTSDPAIQQLPWHQWELLERYPKAEVAVSQPGLAMLGSAAVVEPKFTEAVSPDPVSLKILAVLGDRERIHEGQEQDWLAQLPNAEVTLLIEPELSELNEQFRQQPWQILFFAGSDASQPKNIRINSRETLTPAHLQSSLKLIQGLQLAVISAGDSLAIAETLPQQIPQLVVLREPVPPHLAWAFFKYWLSAHRTGAAFYPAVRQARERLQALEGEFPWATELPMIVQNSAVVLPSWRSLTDESSSQSSPLTSDKQSQPRSAWHQPLKAVAVASLLTAATICGIRTLGWLQPLELKAYDAMLRLRPDEPPDSRLLIVETTDADVDEIEASLSPLIEQLERQGAIAIGLSGFSAARHPALKQLLNRSGRLLIACSPEPPGENFSDRRLDADPVLRRHWLTASSPSDCDSPYAFSTQLALRYLAQQGSSLEPPKLKSLNGGTWQLGPAKIRPIATELGKLLLLNYRSYRSIAAIAPRISLSDALETDLSTEQIRDRIILIGPTAGSPQIATPYGTALPEIIVQAQAISQLLSAALDRRVLLWMPPKLGQWLWIAVGSVAGAAIAQALHRHRWRFLLVGLGLALLLHSGLCFLALVNVGCWLPLVAGSLAIAIAGLARKSLAVTSRLSRANRARPS